MTERPDWQRAFELLGTHAGELVPVVVDESGNLYALLRGEDGAGGLHNVAVDANGQIITVPRGATGNYVDVDADGYFTSVIKGDYEGTPKTVTLDSEGRISAFIIDSSDAWGQLLAVGNAELAARLNPLFRLDRRGSVMFAWDFSSGMGTWSAEGRGTGGGARLAPEHTDRGGYALELTCGSDGSHDALAIYETVCLPAVSYGAQFTFSLEDDPVRIQFTIYYYDGTYEYTAAIRWDVATTTLALYDDAGDWTTVDASADFWENADLFSFLKLAADVEEGTYLRLLYGETERDISAHGIYKVANAAMPHIEVIFDVTGNVFGNDVVYLDSVVVTSDEPA